MPKITLVGQMGSGKSAVGKLLAEKLNYAFADTDADIIAKHGCLDKIYNESIINFRKEEYVMLSKYLLDDSIDDIVISSGGGAITYSANFSLITESSFMIYIRTAPEVILERLTKDDTRSEYFRKYISLDFIQYIQREREFLHRHANLEVENNGTIEDCVTKIMNSVLTT